MSSHQSTAEKVLQSLSAYDIKATGKNKYQSNSPLRPGSNSHAFNLVIENAEHGAYHDHVSGESGSLYDLAQKLGIETPEGGRVAVLDSKRRYADLADYAAAHGAPVKAFEDAGWKETTYQNRPALEFKTASGPRYRFTDGDKPTYKHGLNYTPCWYGMTKAVQKAQANNQPVILCNGEATTITAQHHGMAACAKTSGESELPAELLEQFATAMQERGLKTVWLCYDCDKTGRETAAKVRGQLSMAGFDVSVIDLGLGDSGDLADFCLLYSDRAASELAARANAPAPKTEPRVEIANDDLKTLVNAANALKATISLDARMRDGQELLRVTAALQAQIDAVNGSYGKPKVVTFADLETQQDHELDHPAAQSSLSTGIRVVDRMIGAMLPEVYVLYGATSMGKSTLAAGVTHCMSLLGPGLIVPTESNPMRWFRKLLAYFTFIGSEAIEDGKLTADDKARIRRALALFATTGCGMLDHGAPSISMIRSALLEGVTHGELKGQPYQWVMVDSSSKMAAPGTNGIYERTVAVADGLQALMKEFNIPIWATSQVSRELDSRPAGKKIPLITDGYGGGAIENNAGILIALYRHNYYVQQGLESLDPAFPDGTATAILLKHRWRGGALGTRVLLKHEPGIGFFDQPSKTVDIPATADKGEAVYENHPF